MENHDQAVRIRRMTDDQIMDFIAETKNNAWQEGHSQATGVKDFMDFLKANNIPGIGAVTMSKLTKAASDNGFI